MEQEIWYRGSRVVGERLRETAAAIPDRRFVQCGSPWLTYAEVDELSERAAHGLQNLGLQKGDRVAIMLPNRIEWIIMLFACAKAGLIQVPVNTYLRGEFLRHQLAESGSVAMVTDSLGAAQLAPLADKLPELRHLVFVGDEGPAGGLGSTTVIRYQDLEKSKITGDLPSLSPSDLIGILYTSGTTGPSKGCMITHGYYTGICRAFCEAGFVKEGDTVMTAAPLFHNIGQVWCMMTALAVRGSAAIETEFSASKFMIRARETEATVLVGVAAMGMALLAQPESAHDKDHQVRLASWIPMPEEAQYEFEKRYGISFCGEVFGQTECWPATIGSLHDKRKRRSAGRESAYHHVRVVDDEDFEVPVGEVGEIVIRPREPYAMYQGYWNNHEATVKAFRNLWHHTGDYGRFDDEGYLYFVDRKKDAMRRRGENVSSLELEAAILTHPGVAAVATHAVPSKMSEDDIKACIVPTADVELTPENLFEFFKKEIPYYAIPRYVELIDEIPVSAVGRVQKYKLRERGVTDETWDLDAMGLVVDRAERRT